MIALWIGIVIMIICFCWCLAAFLGNSVENIVASISVAIANGVIVFGLICSTAREGSPIVEIINPKVARTDVTTFIEYDKEYNGTTIKTVFQTDSHKFYIAKDDEIKVKVTHYKNAYGQMALNSKTWEVIVDDQK